MKACHNVSVDVLDQLFDRMHPNYKGTHQGKKAVLIANQQVAKIVPLDQLTQYDVNMLCNKLGIDHHAK